MCAIITQESVQQTDAGFSMSEQYQPHNLTTQASSLSSAKAELNKLKGNSALNEQVCD